MASSKVCDICGKVAVDTVEMKSSNTTPVQVDVCEECLARYKEMVRKFREGAESWVLPVQ